MAFDPQTSIGVSSKMGISLEPIPGVACKARRLIDRSNGNLAMELTEIQRRTLRNVAAPIGSVPGLANTAGTVTVEPTPEGIGELLCTAFGLPDTSARVVPTAPASVTATYVGTSGSDHKNYKIVGMNAVGDGAESAQVTASSINTLGGANYVELRWNPVLTAVFYKVLTESVADSGTFDTLLATVKGNIYWDFGAVGAAYTAFAPTVPAAPTGEAGNYTGTSGSTARNYKIVANSYLGDGTPSSAVSLTNTASSLDGSNYVDLTWNAVSGATSYKILTEAVAGSGTFNRLVGSTTSTSYRVNSDTVSVYSAGTQALNVHIWTDDFDQKTATLTEKRGDFYFAYPGCRAQQITIRVDKTQTEPVSFGFDFGALRENAKFTESGLGLDTAGYDTLNAFGPTQAALVIGGAYNDDARSFDLTINKNVGRRDTLNNYRGPSGHYVQNSTHTGTASLYFSNLTQLERYFGQAVGQTSPFGATNTVTLFTMYLILTSDLNAAGFYNQIIFEMPSIAYSRVGQPLQGPDAIMQEIAFTLYNDATLATSLRVWVVNGQAQSDFTTIGTVISSYPSDSVNPYVS